MEIEEIEMRKEIKPKDIRNITGLKDFERETNILFNAEGDIAEICTTEYEIMKRLQAVAKKNKDTVKVFACAPMNDAERIDCYVFTMPRDMLTAGGESFSKN